jgi:hypothetical protein
MKTLDRLRKNKKIQHIDQEEDVIVVTLNWGTSFYPREHAGVRAFDTVTEIRTAIVDTYPCNCDLCHKETRRTQIQARGWNR